MIEGSGAASGAGSILVTNGSGCGGGGGGEKKTKLVRTVCILHDGEGGPNSGQENTPVTFDEKIREID